jgi:hypothetical protein
LIEGPIFILHKNLIKNREIACATSRRPLMMERKRRQAFAQSCGLQANGIAAAESYNGRAPNILTYFDNRLRKNLIATDREIAAKQASVIRGAPLRLAFTGRLERMKGADDLIKIAVDLDRAGSNFSLDIYDSGSLEPKLRAALKSRDVTAREGAHTSARRLRT